MSLSLVIGNKNYSSWSFRPWFYLKHHGIEFDEIRIPLYQEESKAKILQYSPSGKVPVLIDGELRIWDSLAILEYLAERFPQTQGWPDDFAERALARSLAAEMHAGFTALRTYCGMNCGGRRPPSICRKACNPISTVSARSGNNAGAGTAKTAPGCSAVSALSMRCLRRSRSVSTATS
ncbi:glutathione S-transferase [Methylomonas koyamae]|uniref:glutathione S-transferase n=1 Tax=Methylomonas koyamae TaxID=702114 RepID=UPI000B2B4AC1|nr:glutathione S-transferase [Methylomonas koyamae]